MGYAELSVAAECIRDHFHIRRHEAMTLAEAGYYDVEEVLETPRERLRRIAGVGPSTIGHIEACKRSGKPWLDTDNHTVRKALEEEGLRYL